MNLLDVRNLTIELPTHDQQIIAVDRVSMTIREGEILGLVGESGSGKSLIAKAIVGVLNNRWKVTADRMQWMGEDLLRLPVEERREIIGRDISIIYQEPSRCLDPTAKVGEQLKESIPNSILKANFWQRRKARQEKAEGLLHKVGIKNHKRVMNAYTHELSEGVCQKVMIAMAIAKCPKLIIADEPTASLEATTRAQIFRVLKSLNQLKNTSILLITHDFEIISHWTDHTNVLYCGQLVESGKTSDIITKPFHPYTDALITSVPDFKEATAHKQKLVTLPGTIPSLEHLPIGCRLGPRCPNAKRECVIAPKMTKRQSHSVACHFPLNLTKKETIT